MENATDQAISELERQHPGYQIWVVRRVIGGPVWCARRWDETGATINADTPEHLTDYIRDAGAD
jgi:hypothetical protein